MYVHITNNQKCTTRKIYKTVRETKVQWTQEVSCCWSTSEKDMVGGMVLNWLTQMAAWLSGNALVLINIVALRRARLVLG